MAEETKASVVKDPLTTEAQPMPAWENEVEIWFQGVAQDLAALDIHNRLYTAKEALKARLHGLL